MAAGATMVGLAATGAVASSIASKGVGRDGGVGGTPTFLVRLYDLMAGWGLGALYDRLAADAAAACPAGEVLEIGGGTGLLAMRLLRRAPGVRIHGVDIDETMVGAARKRAEQEALASRATFDVADVAALDVASESVDLAISSMSAHHWDDAIGGLSEIHRVLRPGCRAIVWDIPDLLARLEGRRSRFDRAIAASPFRSARVSRVRWPANLPILVRFELLRET